MGIDPTTTRTFHRTLYAGMLQTVTLLKRNDDQQQGTIRSVSLFECRQSMVFSDGEIIHGDEQVNTRCVWHIPRITLEAAGVDHIMPADRIVNLTASFGVRGYWQPEATTETIRKLFSNHYCVHCLRVDPPS